MDQGPTTPGDDTPDWGQRRRGGPPPPRPSWDEVREEFEQAASAFEQHRVNGGDPPPPPPGDAPRPGPATGPDLSALFVLLDALRRAAPAELQDRTTALIREVLLTLRSLIDWYLERLERPPAKPEVEDIPIE